MNLDSDERLLPKGDFRKGVNIRVSNSEGSDVGSIENILGNEAVSNLDLGPNAVTIGADRSVGLNKIYWLVKSDSGSYFIEYDISQNTTSFVLSDTRSGSANVLGLSTEYHVHRIVIIEDYDNNTTLAIWSDGNKPIRCVNIDRGKNYGANNFTSEAISLIKRPPINMPGITLSNTISGDENYIEERFLMFAYSYKYLDGEYSALSSFTSVAFLGKAFDYDYSTNTNESMVNAFNKVELELNTGNELVTDIRLVYKESNNNTPYIVETFNKADEGWADNSTVTVEYTNNKNKGVLPQDELFRLYDAVPIKANTLEIIDNTLAIADYTENYNLIDVDENKVKIDIVLENSPLAVNNSNATKSVKSLREYEVGICYLDDDARITTVLTSNGNTLNIPGIDADKQNRLSARLSHKAPKFAKFFRFFIKQSKYKYDTIIPTLFYNNGIFVWIKLENDQQDKVNEGDFLIVKADTQGLLSTYVEARVIEIKTQEKNFLEEVESTNTIQQSGLYFKVKPTNWRLNENDFTLHSSTSYDDSSNDKDNPIRGSVSYIDDPVYYGTSGIDDLSSDGTYTGNTDERYRIDIDGVSPNDTFKWSKDDGQTYEQELVQITPGVAQVLDNGVEITFASNTGHDITDTWDIPAKSINDDNLGGDENSKAYGLIASVPGETIEGGARITIKYDESKAATEFIEKSYIASRRYKNIEEWFVKDNIQPDLGIASSRIWFRNGTLASNGHSITIDPNEERMMIIRSAGTQNNDFDSRAVVRTTFTVFQSEFNVIFETKSDIINSDTFFEVGTTYPVDNEGYHIGVGPDDINQSSATSGQFVLDFWNCISWGNGFESYKIKDAFTAKGLNIDTRPNTFIDDYRENYRRGGIILSGRYEQTTNYNAINEFNYSLGNFVDLDDANGAVKFLFSKGKTLIAFQENKITPLGYKKNFIYDQNGVATFIQGEDILTIPESYSGEYGISDNPESFAFFGNRIYCTDRRRGAPIRLSIDGISEINILTKDFFKDLFRNYPDAKYEGAYDPYFDEYLLLVRDGDQQFTIGFKESGYSENNKGWTSFYGFVPEKMLGINNRLYSFKRGQLWVHNSENVPRNNFYGEQYTSKITTVLNDDPINDKIYKVMALSGNKSWDLKAKTNLSETTISKEEFKQKESRFFGHLRQNESDQTLKGGAVQGLGNLQSISGRVLTFNSVSEMVSIGNRIFQNLSGTDTLIGVVESFTETTITLVSVAAAPTVGAFMYNVKSARVEGGNIRGYFLEVELENDDTEFVELFAVECNMVRSDLRSTT